MYRHHVNLRVNLMNLLFQHHHGAMLLKYSGISFISGAVNHGFFSGERSLWTAAIGIVLFVVGAAMEHRLTDNPEEPPSSLIQTLTLGALLSIGLGFFTGGLQHFPDSPARSAWVVPLGFFISVIAMSISGPLTWRTSSTVYTVLAGLMVTASSYGAWQWLERHPQFMGLHAHSHGASPSGLTAFVVDRQLEIRMSDQMRFTPDTLEFKAGETVRLIVHNDGKMPHELVLGTDAEIREHAAEMKKGIPHDHEHMGGNAISLEPGKRGELVVHFAKAGRLQMACLIPGHYEAGMYGAINIAASTAGAKGHHDHGQHRH